MLIRNLRRYPETWVLLLTASLLLPFRAYLAEFPPLILAALGLGIFLLPGAALVCILGDDGNLAERLALAFVASLAIPGLIAQTAIFLHTSIAYYVIGFGALLVALLICAFLQCRRRQLSPPMPDPHRSPLWLQLILAVMVVVLLIFHLNSPLDGDHWDATAYIQNIRYDPHILTGDPKFNAGLTLSPRYDFSAWLVDQALMSAITGQNPVDQFQALRLPMLLLTLAAFYRLSRRIAKRRDVATVMTVIWILYLITSNYGTVAGYELAVRPDLDKVVAGYIVLPVTLAAVLDVFSRRHKRFWAWLLIGSLATTLTHPIASLLIGLSLVWFGLAELWSQRTWSAFWRLTLVALLLMISLISPLYSMVRAATDYDAEDAVLAATSLTDSRDPSMSRRIRAALDLKRLWILGNGSYVMHPRLILQPAHIPAILALPFLFLRQRRSRSARLLFGMFTFITLLVMFPPTAQVLGKFTTPWLFFRLHWPISMAALLIAGWGVGSLLWRIPSPTRRAWVTAGGWLLVCTLAFPWIRSSFWVLHDRKYDPRDNFCVWADDILRPFQELAATDTMVLADTGINICLIGYAPYAGVLEWRTINVVRNYIGAGREAEGWERLWDAQYYAATEFLDARLLSILERWQVEYLVVKLGAPLEPQLRHLPQLFQPIQTASGYRIYAVLPLAERWQEGRCLLSADVCALIQANSLLTNHQWRDAAAAYEPLTAVEDASLQYLAWIGLGRSRLQLSAEDEALAAWQHAHQLLPDEAQPLGLQGDRYALAQRWEAARDAYQQAVERQPQHARYLTRLGDANSALGDVAQAEAAYQAAATQNGRPGSYHYHLSLGQMWLNAGANDRAAAHFDSAYRLYGNDEAAGMLGQVYERTHQWQKAAALYQRLSRRDLWEESGHLGLARVAKAQGDLAQALKQYRLALRLHPLPAGGYDGLSEILQEQEGVPTAMAEIEETVGNRLGFGDALVTMAGLQAQIGAYERALAKIDQAVLWDRMDPRYYNSRSSYQIALGQKDAATAGYRKVLEFNAMNADALLGLAQLASGRGQLDEGEGYATQAAVSSPSQTRSLLMLANMAELRAKPDQALAYYQRAVQNPAAGADEWISLGNFQYRRGQFDQALDSFATALSIEADATAAYRGMSTVHLDRGDPALAAEALDQAVILHRGEAVNHVRIAAIRQQQGEPDAALEALDKALALNPGNLDAYTTLGNLYQQRGQVEQAEAVYRDLVERIPTLAQGYVMLGKLLERQGERAEAKALYRTAIDKVSPSLAGSVQLALAALEARDGSADSALQAYRQTVAAQPMLADAYLAWSQFHLRRGEWQAAADVLAQAAELMPGAPQIALAFAALQANAPDGSAYAVRIGDDAIAPYRDLATRFPGSLDAAIALVDQYVAVGQPQQAMAEIAAAQQVWAQNPTLLARRAKLELALGDSAAAMQTAQQLVAVAPGSVSSWTLLAATHAAVAQFDEADAAYRRATAAAPGSAEAHLALGSFLNARGKRREAMGVLERAVTLDQGATAARLALAQIQEQAGQHEEALHSYQAAVATDATQGQALVGLGQLYAKMGQLATAQETLARAIAVAPADPDVYQAAADLYSRQGWFDLAHEALLTPTTHVPASCKSYEHLGDFLLARAQWDAAESAYRQALDRPGCLASAGRGLGNLYSAQGKPAAAIEAYQSALAAAPGDALLYVELGKLYRAQGQSEEALAHYQRAIAISPTSVEAYIALGEWYQIQAQWEEAQQAYQQAVWVAPMNPAGHIHLEQLRESRTALQVEAAADTF